MVCNILRRTDLISMDFFFLLKNIYYFQIFMYFL